METRMVDVGEVRMSIAEAGVGGRPFLLLHGFTGAKEDFTDWFDELAEWGWHAVAPDHRGHGQTSKPSTGADYSFAILAADSLLLADALGWDRFVVLGHSMGGFVAQEIAVAAPERVDGLILMDTSYTGIDGIDRDLADVAISIAREQGMGTLADLMAARESPLDTPAHRRVESERPGYREFNDRKFRSSSAEMYGALIPELLTKASNLDALRRLSPTPPTLVIVGEQDEPFLGPSREMAGAIPGASLAVISDAGHSPQFENPKEWWESLSLFLAHLQS